MSNSKTTTMPNNSKLFPLYVYAPAAIFLAVILIISISANMPLPFFFRDTAAIGKIPFYAGIASNIGIMLWAATVGICFLAFAVLRNCSAQPVLKQFFWAGGFISLLLLLDDALQIHEVIVPRFLGLSSNWVFLLYAAIAVLFIVRFRDLIAKGRVTLFFTSLIFLGLSVFINRLHAYDMAHLLFIEGRAARFFIEDGFKLLGITGWMGFFANTAFVALTSRKKATAAPEAPARSAPESKPVS